MQSSNPNPSSDKASSQENRTLRDAIRELEDAINSRKAITETKPTPLQQLSQAFFDHGIKPAHERFNFNWNDHRTIAPNQGIVDQVAAYVKTTSQSENKIEEPKVGRLAFLVGTFYNHIKCQPDAALENLVIAEKLLEGEELGWVQIHIAFSYLQKLAAANLAVNPEEAEKYISLVNKYYDAVTSAHDVFYEPTEEKVKLIGFANCVKGLLCYENDQINDAIEAYKTAFGLYNAYDIFDNQYYRAKNCYAMIVAQNGSSAEALQILSQVEEHWSINHDIHSIYAARFYVNYGDFLRQDQPGKLSLAAQKYTKAYQILVNLEGKNSPFCSEVRLKRLNVQAELNAGDSIAPTVMHGLYSGVVNDSKALNSDSEVLSRNVHTVRF